VVTGKDKDGNEIKEYETLAHGVLKTRAEVGGKTGGTFQRMLNEAKDSECLTYDAAAGTYSVNENRVNELKHGVGGPQKGILLKKR
jgi:hypothetical protein